MAARNPFERVLNDDSAETDVMRQPPRDIMADAFLSELMMRLEEASRNGYVPGVRPDYFGHREHNGLPFGPGLRGTGNTYDAINNNPIDFDPFAFGSGRLRERAPPIEGPFDYDPFAPGAGLEDEIVEPFDQFSLDALPSAGTNGFNDFDEQDPFSPSPQPRLPSFPAYQPDPNLDRLRQAIRPGYAQLSTYGYSEPNRDPYAQDLTALLRRLVRQA